MRQSIWKVYDEIQSTTGHPPGYVLLDGSRLNLGALVMTPRSAALVIGAPAEGQSAQEGVLVIDARAKPHHAPPLVEDPEITRRVDSLAARGGPLAKWL